MSSIKSIKQARLKKLENIRKAKVNPYPAKAKRTHTCQQVIDKFEQLMTEKKKMILVGRLRTIRQHGGSTFAHIEDGSAKLQIYLKRDELNEKKYKFFLDNFDIGDFIEAKGMLFLTKKGEKTLLVKDYRILAKSLVPLPEKWHGLKDVEERFRKRYLDLLMNKEVRNKFLNF
jgi:lysyl-tRNA synthetase class 2